MSILFSSTRHDFTVVVGIFLIAVALIAGMVGCVGEGGGGGGGGGTQYSLTIDSTSGGIVTTPGEGTFAYDEGTPVLLMVSVDPGYQFIEWAGDVGTVANVAAAKKRGPDLQLCRPRHVPGRRLQRHTSSTARHGAQGRCCPAWQ